MGTSGHWGLGSLRAHRRVGVAVLCFAIVLQFVSLFGHAHPRDGTGAAHALKAHVAATVGEAHAAADPAPLPSADDEASCAVCLVGHLASVAIAPSAPTLFAPLAHAPRAPPAVDLVSGAEVDRPFWSRGPPAV